MTKKLFKSSVLLVLLVLAFWLNNSWLSALTAGTYLFVFPLILTEFFEFFVKKKLVKSIEGRLYKNIIKWAIGGVLLLMIYFLNNVFIGFDPIVAIPTISTFITSIIVILNIKTRKKDEKIKVINKLTLKNNAPDIAALAIFLASFIYGICQWSGSYTQLTDLMNHMTASNSLNNGMFSFFPNNLTPSIQLPAYTTVYHTLLASLLTIIKNGDIIKLQFLTQIPILLTTYFVYKSFIKTLYPKINKWVIAAVSALIIIPNGGTLESIHYAIVPNQIVFLLFPIIATLVLQKKYRIAIITIILSSIFHFISTFIVLCSIILILAIQNKKIKNILHHKIVSKIIPTTIIICIAIAVTDLFTRWIGIPDLLLSLTDAMGVKSELISTALRDANEINSQKKLLLKSLRYYTLPILGMVFIITFLGNYFYKKRIWLFLPLTIFFLISLLPAPFSHRFNTMLLAFLIPLIPDFIQQIKMPKINNQFLTTFLAFGLLTISSSHVFYNFARKPYPYFQYNMFSSQEIEASQIIAEDLENQNISTDDVYILSNPSMKMVMQSIGKIKGSGSYMSVKQRSEIKDDLYYGRTECEELSDDSYIVTISSPRTLQWLSKKDLGNVWYYDNEYAHDGRRVKFPKGAEIQTIGKVQYTIYKCN